jgi:hypothetical protein
MISGKTATLTSKIATHRYPLLQEFGFNIIEMYAVRCDIAGDSNE